MTMIYTSLVAQMGKNLPAMQAFQVLFLGREDPLEEGMATHSGIFAWRIPMDRGYSQGIAKSWTQLGDQHTPLDIKQPARSYCMAQARILSIWSSPMSEKNLEKNIDVCIHM